MVPALIALSLCISAETPNCCYPFEQVEKRLQQLQGDEVRSVDHASFRMQSYVVPDMTSSTYTPTSHYIPTDWSAHTPIHTLVWG